MAAGGLQISSFSLFSSFVFSILLCNICSADCEYILGLQFAVGM